MKKSYILLLFSGFIFLASYSKHEDFQSANESSHFRLVKTNSKQAIDPELASLQEPTIGESTVERPYAGKKGSKQTPGNHESSNYIRGQSKK